MNNINDIDTGLGWLDRALSVVEKYKILTIFKGILLVVIVALTISFIRNPYGLFDKFVEYQNRKHDDAIELRMKNNEKLHMLCTKLLYRTEADRVMLLDTHNSGSSLSGLPFLKCSATYEALNEGVTPIADQYQQVQLSLMPFASYLFKERYWCGDITELEEIDRALYHKMAGNGTQHIAACVVDGVEKPLAFLIVSYREKPSEHECEKVRESIEGMALQTALLLEMKKMNKHE